MKLSIQIIRHLVVVAFAAIAQGEICVAATADTAHDLLLKHLDPVLAVPADVVEVVFSAGKFSHLEYVPKGVATVSRPALLQHQRLQQPEMQKFGFCKPDRKGALALTKRPCGFVLPLEKASSPVDLLNFEKMVIKGKFEGSWKIALADAHLAAKEENVVIGEVADAVGAGVSLETAARTIDLRKSSQLVFILASPKGSLQVDEIELLPASPRPARPEIRSMWLWDSRVPLARPKEVADDLRRRGVGRIYLQVADDPEPLAPFLAQANKRGIEVWALDGSPDYAEHPGPLLARVQAVKEFNSRHAGAPFKGFQIDVEPHLKRDFRLRLDFYAGKYVALVRELKEIKGAGLPLSVVIPFWYDSLMFEDRSLTWHLFRWADEAAIMSYRTSLPEIEDIAHEELAYGERMNIPVFLGLETTAIPDEEHIVFRRCGALDLTSSASSASWCRQSGYSVPGGKISFSGKPDAFFGTLNRRPAGSSFGGWIIHSYESAPR